MSVLDKVRRWIDGESAELVLENAARDAQVKPRSQSEEFIVKIARAIEAVMQNEMVPLPQGTTIIPSEYLIFLSNEDDKEWQGVKRRGLEQGLYHILAERANEIAGKKKLETKSFVLELRIDGTLERGEIRVQHSWEDSSSGKTGVLARPAITKGDLSQEPPPTVKYSPPQASPPPTPNFTAPPTFVVGGPPKTGSHQVADGEEMTSVRQRPAELFRLEIWLNGVRQNVLPIYKNEISVGRGSRSRPVDITLAGDPEVSRRHVTIGTDANGRFWVVNEGRNAATINNVELPSGQRIVLNPGVSLTICSYTLRIQPR